MIGSGGNFATGPAFIIQDEMPKMRQIVVKEKTEVKAKDQDTLSPLSNVAAPKEEPKSPPSDVQEKLEKDVAGNDEQKLQAIPQPYAELEAQQQQKEMPEVPDEKRFEIPPQDNNDPGLDKGGNDIPPQPDAVNFVNNSNPDAYVPNGDEKEFEERLKSILKCHDREYIPETLQRGDFWVLKNYIRADHGELKCHETITYTTHADYTFLDNVIPLLERWNAPLSIALHAPGTDFPPTINAIKYLRDCLPESHLVRQYATFHIYFSTKHIPKNVPKDDKVLEPLYNCSIPAPYFNVSSNQMYKTQKKLLYPVNVGRNIARDSALTHFILASDVELYPNPGLVRKFLEMIARNDPVLQRKSPKVFPLSIFEVESSAPVPKDKTELQELLRTGKAIPFHKRVCSSCHGVPKAKEWIVANETEELGVFHIGKRVGYFVHWEPVYIGTNAEPHYDERLSWEGKSDKMTQGYALCALDYEFQILDNAFLVHKPGIKVLKKDTRRAMLANKTNQLIKKIIYPELRIMYGTRKGCAV